MSISTISTINPYLLKKNVLAVSYNIPSKLCSYTFEAGGTDSSGNGYTATDTGSCITSASYKFGTKSCYANGNTGITAYILTPSMTFVNANGLSFSFWINKVGVSQTGDMKMFEFTADKLCLYSAGGGNNISMAYGTTMTITTNVWTHIVYTINSAGFLTAYKDGNPTSVYTQSTTNYPTGTTLSGRILRSLGSGHSAMNGYFDNFKIFNKILTTTEIGWLYNNIDT